MDKALCKLAVVPKECRVYSCDIGWIENTLVASTLLCFLKICTHFFDFMYPNNNLLFQQNNVPCNQAAQNWFKKLSGNF